MSCPTPTKPLDPWTPGPPNRAPATPPAAAQVQQLVYVYVCVYVYAYAYVYVCEAAAQVQQLGTRLPHAHARVCMRMRPCIHACCRYSSWALGCRTKNPPLQWLRCLPPSAWGSLRGLCFAAAAAAAGAGGGSVGQGTSMQMRQRSGRTCSHSSHLHSVWCRALRCSTATPCTGTHAWTNGRHCLHILRIFNDNVGGRRKLQEGGHACRGSHTESRVGHGLGWVRGGRAKREVLKSYRLVRLRNEGTWKI